MARLKFLIQITRQHGYNLKISVESAGELEKLIFVRNIVLRANSSNYRASVVQKDMCLATAKLERFSVSGVFLFIFN